jgi:hypothetical protein
MARYTRAPEIASIEPLPRNLRRGLERGARLDREWFSQHKNQSRVVYLRRALKDEAAALIATSDLPRPERGQCVLVAVIRVGNFRARKPLIWRGKLPPMDREDLALSVALSTGEVSLTGLLHKAAQQPHAVQ